MQSRYLCKKLAKYAPKLKKELTPEELVKIGRKAKSFKIWDLILNRIDFKSLSLDETIDLCIKSKSLFFSSRIIDGKSKKRKKIKFTME